MRHQTVNFLIRFTHSILDCLTYHTAVFAVRLSLAKLQTLG